MTAYYHSRSQVKKIPMRIPFNADEVYVHFSSECSASLWIRLLEIRAQHIPIVQFLNKNIDKRYCFQHLGIPASLAETRGVKRLNRFLSYAEKNTAISLNFRRQTRPTAKIASREGLCKFSKMGQLDSFDQAVGEFSIADANQNAKDHAALIAAEKSGRINDQRPSSFFTTSSVVIRPLAM